MAALIWIDPQRLKQAQPSQNTIYGVDFATASPYPSQGSYSAWATKVNTTPEWPSAPMRYEIGSYPTVDEAIAACQLDYDTYADKWPNVP